MYKIGDRVKFTFLSEELFGEIIGKIDKVKWKIKDDSGMVYPFIYGNEPKKVKGVKYETPLGIIISKIN
jgi:hypothetical protein